MDLAVESFYEFNTDKCGGKRCFNRLKSSIEYDCPEEFRCYTIFVRVEPYSTRLLVRNYFQRSLSLLQRFFAENTHFGCAIHVIKDKAEINCVYMKMKKSAIAARA